MFVVVKTTSRIIGWHGSETSLRQKSSIHRMFKSIIVPGEDREEGTLNLKPTCGTMQCMPWTDPSHSRRAILDFLEEFEFYDGLQVMPPVKSYKDFVVFDMAHKHPYTFNDTNLFDQGCALDAGVANPMDMLLSNLRL